MQHRNRMSRWEPTLYKPNGARNLEAALCETAFPTCASLFLPSKIQNHQSSLSTLHSPLSTLHSPLQRRHRLQINHRRLDIPMPQQFLDRLEMVSGKQQMTRKRMPQNMRAHTFRDSRRLRRPLHRPLHMAVVKMVAALLRASVFNRHTGESRCWKKPLPHKLASRVLVFLLQLFRQKCPRVADLDVLLMPSPHGVNLPRQSLLSIREHAKMGGYPDWPNHLFCRNVLRAERYR